MVADKCSSPSCVRVLRRTAAHTDIHRRVDGSTTRLRMDRRIAGNPRLSREKLRRWDSRDRFSAPRERREELGTHEGSTLRDRLHRLCYGHYPLGYNPASQRKDGVGSCVSSPPQSPVNLRLK